MAAWVVLAACRRDLAPAVPVTAATTGAPTVDRPEGVQDGMELELANGETPVGAAAVAQAEVTPLSDSIRDALLARLPALSSALTVPFALRPASTPPPRPGSQVDLAFPAPTAEASPDLPAGPVSVVRHAPSGDVPLAAVVSLTFDRPMVALGSVSAMSQTLPAVLTPQPEGAWRWLGTRTLVFEAEGRLPMATTYTLSVAPGLVGSDGQSTTAAFTDSFTLPALSVEAWAPSAGAITGLQPVLVVAGDQDLRAEALLPHLNLSGGGETVPLRLATPGEIEADASARALYRDRPRDRLGAYVPARPLARATSYALTLAKGAPSAEGPRPTEEDQGSAFATYGALRVASTRCGWEKICRPDRAFEIEFTQDLDPSQDLAPRVKISPAVADGNVTVSGSWIAITGRTEPNTTYTVSLEGITDRWGQTLEGNSTARFAVGAAEPLWPDLRPAGPDPLIPDPFAPPVARFIVQGQSAVRVRVMRVEPGDWALYVDRNNHQRGGDQPSLGEVVLDEIRTTPKSITRAEELVVDLAPYATGGFGLFVVQVSSLPTEIRDRQRETSTWVQASRLGVAVLADAEDTLVAVHDLVTGQPVPNAAIALGKEKLGTTDSAGLAKLPALHDRPTEPLVVSMGPDRMVLSASGGAWAWGQWAPSRQGTQLVAHLFDDRGLYRPGETVHLKGWLRHVGHDKGGDLLPLDVPEGTTVAWAARDAMGVPMGEGTLQTDAAGGVQLDLVLPGTPALGDAWVELTVLGTSFSHSFSLREFRRPTFEVTAQALSEGPHVVGSPVLVSATAAYLSGGALPGAPVQWQVYDEPASWRPVGWADWTFGAWTPPWFHHDGPMFKRGGGFHDGGGGPKASWEARTDALGIHHLTVTPRSVWPPAPHTLRMEATVQDVDRQASTASTSVLVHPSAVYVGLRASDGIVEAKQKLKTELVVVDLDGNAVPGRPVEAALVREGMSWTPQGWKTVEHDRLPCSTVSAEGPVPCSFTPPVGGTWQLEARTTDNQGRVALSRRPVWVMGGDEVARTETVDQESIELVPDRAEVLPGETARVLAQLPFEATEALITWQRSGVVHHERVANPGRAFTFEVRADLAHAPGLTVQVDAFGLAPRADGSPRPAYATGTVRLAVPPAARRLTVTVTPEQRASEPGAVVPLRVRVTDARGEPVAGAQVVIAMVDEAVLALSGHEVLDPLLTFHPERDPGVLAHHGRAQIGLVRAVADTTPEEAPAPAMEMANGMLRMDADGAAPEMMRMTKSMAGAPAGGEPAAPAIHLRTDLRPDALWVPAARTDADGTVQIAATLPDSLTRYRISAVAVGADRGFGLGEADLTARLPLQVRPSPPRFLQFGDRAEFPFVVQNATDVDLVVDLAVRASNLDLGAPAVGLRATIPAHDRREVRVPAATQEAGRAFVQVAIASGRYTDAAGFDLPVWTPATSEATAVTGVLDGPSGPVAIGQRLDVPQDAWPQFGGLAIQTSSTQLQSLTDAFVYVLDYPYGCSEQISSRVLSVAALRDVLTAFDAPGLPDRATLEAAVGRDLEELLRRQNSDGSWGWWRRDERGDPWLTLHAVHALVRARDAGFEVPPEPLNRGLQRIANLTPLFDTWWSEHARDVANAQSIAVRQVAGLNVGPQAVALYGAKRTQPLSLEALGWLLPSLHQAGSPRAVEVLRHLENQATETTSTAHWVTDYDETDAAVLLRGDRRTDAVLLEALLQVDPTSDLLPKVVEGLLGARVRGRWGTTQENTWVLLALQRSFRVSEAVTPDAMVRAWVGPALAQEHAFRGRTTERTHTSVPMAQLQTAPDANVVLQREGAGRIYWRLALSYAPKALVMEPLEAGYTVSRRYEAVDDPTDVRRDLDGTWQIRAGARVRVRVDMLAASTRYHTALVDPLPAGLEVIDPGLKTSGTLPADPGGDLASRSSWWWGPWYDHENVRDERVEAFARFLPAGVWRYTYVARATTPGEFVVPPAKAEEMYHPETFGRSGSDRVRIVP